MKEQYTKGEILFLGAFIVCLAASLMGTTKLINLLPFPGIVEVLKGLAACIICLKIISEKEYGNSQLIVIFGVLTATFISCCICKDYSLFYSACFILGAHDIPFRTIMKITVFLQALVIVMTAIGVWAGVISNQAVGTMVWSNTVVADDAAVRYNLGFAHPNTISAIVLFMTLAYMCLKKNFSFIEMLIALFVNYMVYQKTGSRTSFLITVMFIPLMFLFLKKKYMQRYWKVLLLISPIVIIAVSMMVQIFYNPSNSVLYKLNSVLSTRLELGHHGFWNYGITLFGQEIVWITDTEYNYVDCSYLRIFLQNGIIVFIFVCIACVRTMHKLVKAEQKGLCIGFLAVLVHSMIEPNLFGMALQPFFLLMGNIENLDVQNDGMKNAE